MSTQSPPPPRAADPPTGIGDIDDDRLYLASEIAPLLRVSDRRLREILHRAKIPTTPVGLGTRRLVRIRGSVAKALLNGEYDLTGAPPARADTTYHDPVNRRRSI
jgi:hypothetical protein